jgi:hypothetical protein
MPGAVATGTPGGNGVHGLHGLGKFEKVVVAVPGLDDAVGVQQQAVAGGERVALRLQ